MSGHLTIEAADWPEIERGADLGALAVSSFDLQDGDIIVVTSKVVSKAEGLSFRGDRREIIDAEAQRVVARRGETVIAKTRHGLVMAAAGVDASNVEPGLVLTLPPDPDESAWWIRRRVFVLTGVNVGVVVTDTAGRAWRVGQTDHAIGCAGIAPLRSYAGTTDPYGNPLAVTETAIADELAAATDLVKGKIAGRPVARVRGLGEAVLAADEDGPGARALVRPAAADLFGLGAREAVVAAALRRSDAGFAAADPGDRDPFGAVSPADPAVRLTVVRESDGWVVTVSVDDAGGSESWLEAGRIAERIDAIGFASGLRPSAVPAREAPGLRIVAHSHWMPKYTHPSLPPPETGQKDTTARE